MGTGQLRSVRVHGSIEDWHAAGFAGEDTVVIGSTIIIPTGAPKPEGGRDAVIAASIDDIEHLAGLALEPWTDRGDAGAPVDHPNGVVAIDHIVVTTPDSDRTTAEFEAAGFDVRRVRRIPQEGGDRRQTFFWLGDVICEVVGPDEPTGSGPASWWGLALTVQDLEATAELLGDVLTPIKPAVQPGRVVSTLAGDVGPPVPILFISPHTRSR